jgi:hypothetical protein
MTTNNFCFYLKNRLIQTSQTGGQQYSDTSTLEFPVSGKSIPDMCTIQSLVTLGPGAAKSLTRDIVNSVGLS